MKFLKKIRLVDCGNDSSEQDNDSSVLSFESTANDQRTDDNNNLPGAKAPAINSELENYKIDDNVVTGDDDNGNDDDNNGAEVMSGDNKDEHSEGEDSVSNKDITNSTSIPFDVDSPWMLLVVVVDDDLDDDPDNYGEFCVNNDLNNDGVFDNGNVSNGKVTYV